MGDVNLPTTQLDMYILNIFKTFDKFNGFFFNCLGHGCDYVKNKSGSYMEYGRFDNTS